MNGFHLNNIYGYPQKPRLIDIHIHADLIIIRLSLLMSPCPLTHVCVIWGQLKMPGTKGWYNYARSISSV